MLLALFFACDLPAPTFVDKKMIDDAHHRGDTKAICTGLRMKDESTRGYAAEKLATWVRPVDCLCDGMLRDGAWDLPIVRAMAKGLDDAHVGCAATLLDDLGQPARADLVNQLVRIKAPAIGTRLKAAAKGDSDPLVRAAAMAVLRAEKDPEVLAIVSTALSDPDPKLRAAAATALTGTPASKEGLVTATRDPAPEVRSAALAALRAIPGFPFAEVACPALRTDTEATVRAAAATAMKGTRDEALIACLRDHMLELEADTSVRLAMLATLHSSPATSAADVLCDAIPFWVHSYIGEEKPEREGPADILFAQNNRDFERSYDCVAKALKVGGYNSCEQRYYMNDWFHELGAKNTAPNRCNAKPRGGGRASPGEIVF